jgi:hypothetical protein
MVIFHCPDNRQKFTAGSYACPAGENVREERLLPLHPAVGLAGRAKPNHALAQRGLLPQASWISHSMHPPAADDRDAGHGFIRSTATKRKYIRSNALAEIAGERVASRT